MADSSEDNVAQPELEGEAASGLMSLLQTYMPAAVAAGNQPRAAAYQDALAACQELRITLSNIDPQADSAVLTQVASVLALL